jgi:hypothetical protein
MFKNERIRKMASYKVVVLVNVPDNFDEEGVFSSVGEALSNDEDIRKVDVVSIEKNDGLGIGDGEVNSEAKPY